MSERHALLPLRAFLGATFVYAGVDKLADPVFLDAGTFGSLATQLDAARGPLESLLDSLVPHAGLLGLVVAVLEIVVGLAALTGILTKPAAWTGAALCAGFALTIGWGADPWYFGQDLPYLAAWLPLAIGGPGEWTVPDLLRRIGAERADEADLAPASPGRRALLLHGGAVLLGAGSIAGAARALAGPLTRAVAATDVATTPVTIAGRSSKLASTSGPTAAVATTTSTTVLAPATTSTTAAPAARPAQQQAATPTTSQPAAPPTQPPTTQAPVPTTTTTTTTAPPATTTTLPPEASLGPVIATSASVKPGVAIPFQDPRSGRRGLLVRRADGVLVAFDETCTHQGCSVLFIAEEKRFGCPCHGSSFDATTGVVLNGPATAPLPQWAITESGGEIRLA